MRITALLPLFLFGCAPSDEFTPEETSAALGAAATGPSVNVELDVEAAVVTLYPVRYDAEGELTWVGSPLTSGTVLDGMATLTLPARAAARDKDSAAPNKPITYAVVAQQLDTEGVLSTYVAVGYDQLVYFNGKDRKRSGWYVASPSAGKTAYASTDRIVRMDTTINPAAGVRIAGKRGDIEEGTVRLGFEVEGSPVDAEEWTGSVGMEFGFSAQGDPPVAWSSDDGSMVSTMAPRPFLDADEDGNWGEADQAVGWMCWGARPVLVSYQEGVTQFEKALMYTKEHVVTGWHAYAASDEGQELMASDAEYVLNEDCAGAMVATFNEEEESALP